jgi:hypothetical protein
VLTEDKANVGLVKNLHVRSAILKILIGLEFSESINFNILIIEDDDMLL